MLKKARLALFAGIAGLAMATAGTAQAQTSSDESAAILVWPKVVYDSTGGLLGAPQDTLINLSSTATSSLKQAHCFLVNATSHCSNSNAACLDSSECGGGGECVPGWNEIDFNVFITQEQPLAWLASDGMSINDLPIVGPGVCSNSPRICFSDVQCGGGSCVIGPNGQNNIGTGIPPVPEDPFIGSLTCIQYDPTQNPPVPDQSSTTNALIGEGTIFTAGLVTGDPMDGAKYNAVGFKAVADAGADTDNVLELGTPGNPDPTADYDGCAGTLILNHYFDNAIDPIGIVSGPSSDNGPTSTSLTLVPCGNDLLRQIPGSLVAQFLVFNEFEQRFSSSTTVDCVFNSPISNIDTRNPLRSIWSAGVSGTVTGQTRIQGVGNAATGKGLTGIATLSILTPSGPTTSAYSLDQMGTSAGGDLLIIP